MNESIFEFSSYTFTECVWEAGNPGLHGHLAHNLVEEDIDRGKGKNGKNGK